MWQKVLQSGGGGGSEIDKQFVLLTPFLTADNGKITADFIASGRQAWWGFQSVVPYASNANTFWYGGNGTHYIQYQFDKPCVVNLVTFRSAGRYKLSLQGLVNGVWEELGTENTNSTNTSFDFYRCISTKNTPVTAVRLLCENADTIGIANIQIYGYET